MGIIGIIFENLPEPNTIAGFFLYSFLVYIFLFGIGLIFGTAEDEKPPEEARKQETTTSIKEEEGEDEDEKELKKDK